MPLSNDQKIIAGIIGGAAILGFVFRKQVQLGIAKVGELIETAKEGSKINAMVPSAQTALRTLRANLLAKGIKTFVGSTRRTEAEQAANVAKGVSATKNSWHLLGRGVDLYPYDPDTGQPDLNGKRVDLFRTMQQEGSKLGWTNLAFNPDGSKRYITTNKGKIWDGGHMQWQEGMTFAQAANVGGSALAQADLSFLDDEELFG